MADKLYGCAFRILTLGVLVMAIRVAFHLLQQGPAK